MLYATPNQFGLSLNQFCDLFPQLSFSKSGSVSGADGWSYTPVALPEYNPATHAVREVAPLDGVQQWEVYPLSPEQVEANQAAAAQVARKQAKATRQAAVDAIQVTTQVGNTFDGDETSQTRMARAIIALQATGTPSVTWVLADNTVIQATGAELSEALALAGAAQAAVWVLE